MGTASALASSGVVFQALLRNPLASPDVIGISLIFTASLGFFDLALAIDVFAFVTIYNLRRAAILKAA